ncbi:MAG: class I SAM-dependent methyltransferase [Actinomycetota bacterium]|nr:class I SAM-dependent methyltransferase [Actinomycetota bacterium]
MSLYNRRFFQRQSKPSAESAEVVAPLIASLLGTPGSVLDVGCGIGPWLSVWADLPGVNEVVGVDGDYVDRHQLMIPPGQFHAANLSKPLDLGRRFDLVESVEVAEHLPEASADTFVRSLTRHGSTVLFSAAVPAQGGKDHINERLPSYWATKFAALGFEVFDVVRWRLWDNPKVSFEYRQNLLLFAEGEPAERLRGVSSPRSLDVVHPEMLEWFSIRRVIQTGANRATALLRQRTPTS